MFPGCIIVASCQGLNSRDTSIRGLGQVCGHGGKLDLSSMFELWQIGRQPQEEDAMNSSSLSE
jgi:hypothetical protein